MYEVFEHTADLGLRVRAPSLEALLAEAARGFFSLIVTNLDEVRPVLSVEYSIEGSDPHYLLFDWLNELLYAYETTHVVFVAFEVQLTAGGLTAIARGEHIDAARHQLEHEVKAITYHALKVEQQAGGWLAEVIVDI